MGCHRLTYHQKTLSKTESTPIFVMGKKQGSDYQVFGMQMPGRNSSAGDYRYGFNGMESDNEVKGEKNSYDFGARMYDPRIGKFLSIDPKAGYYPYMSPYCYAANSPILLIDEDGKGPLSTLLRFATWGHRMIAKLTGTVVQFGLNGKAIAGLGIASAGAVANGGIAIDKKGNIGLYMSASAFGTFFPGSGMSYSTDDDINADHNIVVLGEVSVSAEAKFTNKENVIDLAGNGISTPQIARMNIGEDIDLSAKAGAGGGISFDGETFGASIGYGIGASLSVIADNKFVFAFSLKDVRVFEYAQNKISKAEDKGYNVTYSSFVDKDGFTNIYAKMEKTKKNGKIKTKSTTIISIKQDKEKNAVYTKNVKR